MKLQEDLEVFVPRGYKQDFRPQRGMWAPGVYLNICIPCDAKFIGDKRAFECADCAYGAENNHPINNDQEKDN